MSNGLADSLPGPRAVLQGSRALRWTIGVGVAAVAGVGLVLLFLLTQATNNRELYERNYARLFTLNVVVATVLLLVIIWITARLLMRLRQKRFGSRLLVKLAAIFALAGFVCKRKRRLRILIRLFSCEKLLAFSLGFSNLK